MLYGSFLSQRTVLKDEKEEKKKTWPMNRSLANKYLMSLYDPVYVTRQKTAFLSLRYEREWIGRVKSRGICHSHRFSSHRCFTEWKKGEKGG